jgi:hypothetical protein
MLHQQNWTTVQARASDARTPEDVRALFSLSVAERRKFVSKRETSGQEIAGTGALVFEGEKLDLERPH